MNESSKYFRRMVQRESFNNRFFEKSWDSLKGLGKASIIGLKYASLGIVGFTILGLAGTIGYGLLFGGIKDLKQSKLEKRMIETINAKLVGKAVYLVNNDKSPKKETDKLLKKIGINEESIEKYNNWNLHFNKKTKNLRIDATFKGKDENDKMVTLQEGFLDIPRDDGAKRLGRYIIDYTNEKKAKEG